MNINELYEEIKKEAPLPKKYKEFKLKEDFKKILDNLSAEPGSNEISWYIIESGRKIEKYISKEDKNLFYLGFRTKHHQNRKDEISLNDTIEELWKYKTDINKNGLFIFNKGSRDYIREHYEKKIKGKIMNINEICGKILMKEGYLYEGKEEDFKNGDSAYFIPDWGRPKGKLIVSKVDNKTKKCQVSDEKNHEWTVPFSQLTKTKPKK